MKKTALSLLVGIFLLVMLLYTMGGEKILSLLSMTNPYLFFYAGILSLLMGFFLSYKLKILIPELSLKESFLSHQGGMFFSNITPGRIGYFYTAYSLSVKTSTSTSKNMGLIAIIQGLMMTSKLIILTFAIIYLSFLVEITPLFLISLVVPAVMAGATFFVLYTKVPHNMVKKIPIFNRIIKYLELMQHGAKEIKKSDVFKMFILDAVCWVLTGLQFYFLASAIGMKIDIVMAIMLSQLLSVLMFVPVSPAGLGITESGGVILFILLGFTAPQAISLILLWRLNNIISDGITGVWDLKTVKLPKEWGF